MAHIRILRDGYGMLCAAAALAVAAVLIPYAGIVVNGQDQTQLQWKILTELAETVDALLKQMQSDMLEKARKHVESHTYTATTREEFEEIFATKTGFVKAMWCGETSCEEAIKENMAVTSRCMPFHQECLSDKCVYCGKPAKKMVYWGRAY